MCQILSGLMHEVSTKRCARKFCSYKKDKTSLHNVMQELPALNPSKCARVRMVKNDNFFTFTFSLVCVRF